MAKKQRRNPPSRKRYEQDNPVVSCRLPREIYDRLRVAKEKEGMSYADIFKVGLGLLEVKMRAEEKVRYQAYHEGHRKGYELAESIYRVSYPCSKCGEIMPVTSDAEKKAIREFMIRSRWHHADCNDPRNYI